MRGGCATHPGMSPGMPLSAFPTQPQESPGQGVAQAQGITTTVTGVMPRKPEDATTLKANNYRAPGRGIKPPLLQKGCEELFAVHSKNLSAWAGTWSVGARRWSLDTNSSVCPSGRPWPSSHLTGTHHTVLNTEAQLVRGVRASDDSRGDRGTVHNVQCHLSLVLQLLESGMGLGQILESYSDWSRGDAATLLM